MSFVIQTIIAIILAPICIYSFSVLCEWVEDFVADVRCVVNDIKAMIRR